MQTPTAPSQKVPTRPRVDTFSSAVVASALLAATGAQAATSATGSCGKGVGGSLDDIPSFVVECPSGSWVDPRPGTTSTASWSASAAGGQLRATASVAVNTLPPLGQSVPLALGVGVDAVARQTDELLFTAPGVAAGTPAKMSFGMQIDGVLGAFNLSTSGNAASRASWIFRADSYANRRSLGAVSAGSEVTNFYDWGLAGDPDVDALYSFELPVVLGQTVMLDLLVQARASASAWRAGSPGTAAYLTPTQSSAVSNFGSTATWQGITSLKLNDGTPLQNWTLSSTSGFDYTRPVPEPGSWLLLAGGLALLAGVRGRARLAPSGMAT